MDEEKDNIEKTEDLDDEIGEDVEEDFVDDDYESDGYIESEDPFVRGYQRGNRFVQGNNAKNNPLIRKQNYGNNGNNENDSLKDNIRRQAKVPSKKDNIAKNSNGSTPYSKDGNNQMAMNKSKNTMDSIHKNNDNSEENDSGNRGSGEGIKGAAQKAATNMATKAVQSKTGMSSETASKMVNMASSFQNNFSKYKIYLLVGGFFVVFLLLTVVIVGGEGGDSESSSETNSSLSKFYSSTMTNEELYKFFADNGYIDYDICMDSSGKLDDNCPFITFMTNIKDNTDDENQFLYIFYAITYKRQYEDYIYKSDELEALINNRASLSTYLNGEYLATYRKDIDQSFDLYGYIKKIISSNQTFTTYKVCDSIVVDGTDEPISFEIYVAGVVKHEISSNENDEAIKALSIIVRSYAYSLSNGCESPVSNNGDYQIYEPIDTNNPDDVRILNLVSSTSRKVIENSSRKIISPNYDNFCYDRKDSENYYLKQKNLSIPISWVNNKKFEILFSDTYEDMDGTERTIGWAITNCMCNSDDNLNACTDKLGKYMAKGYENGFSKYGAVYLSEQGKNYEEILKYFFGDDIIMDTLSSEFTVDPNTGFKMRISRALRDNPYFYTSNNIEFPSLEGECVWYAYGRANEILNQWKSEGKNINKKYNIASDGGATCETARAYGYRINNGLSNVESGSVISWRYGRYGHVAIVEKVNDDGSIEISEGGLAYFRLGNFASSNSTIVNLSNGKRFDAGPYLGNIWDSLAFVSRDELCEANGSGCQNYEILPGGIYAGVTPVCTIPLSQFIE